MIVVGMDLTLQDLRYVRRNPKSLILGLFGQFLLPAIALALVRVFRFEIVIVSGILLMAASPAGGISNYYSYLARANTALSVVLTTASCLCAGVTMPLLLHLFSFLVGTSTGFAVPLPVLFVQVFLMLVIPIVAGILIRSFRPQFVAKHSEILRKLSLAGLAALIIFVIQQGRELFFHRALEIMFASGLLILLSMGAGFLLGFLLRIPPSDSFTISVEFAVRNVAIATAIAVTALGKTEFAFFATAYFLTEIPIILLAAKFFRIIKQRRPNGAPASRPAA